MSSSDDKLAAARRRLMEAEASVLLALASARSSLTELEEENRELRREALKRNVEFYTEAQFATLLQVSESTIARERKRGIIEPLRIGGLIRYSSLHVEQAHEIFVKKRIRHILKKAS